MTDTVVTGQDTILGLNFLSLYLGGVLKGLVSAERGYISELQRTYQWATKVVETVDLIKC